MQDPTTEGGLGPRPGVEPPAGILFDVDGTLIDTYRLYLESYRQALAPYLGYAPEATEIAARRPSAERHFLVEWIGEENADACHAAMCRHYADLHGALCDGLYDGVREMLAGLRSAGLPIGVVTGKSREAWEVTTRHLELGRFEVVVTSDHAREPKPHPAGLEQAAAALEIGPAALVYIGDSSADMEAGRLAGMRIGAALWPKTAAGERGAFLERIRRFEPDWIFERPADLVRAFAAWC